MYRAVSGNYFRAVGTPILRGRAIEPTDTAGAPAVAVVNQRFARQLFPNEDPIGRTIDVAPLRGTEVARGTLTIVGVANDIKEVGLNEVPFTDIYVPFAQYPATAVNLIVRGPGPDAALTTALRDAAANVDATMPVTTATSFPDMVRDSAKGARFNLIIVGGFAAAALLVAAIGLYGAMAYAATARWREYGVRLALGATPRRLVGRALWQAGRLGLVGGVIGIGGALLLARWLGDSLYLVARVHSGVLYGVTTTDPLSLAAALAGVVVLALLAGTIPARRVSKIDPVRALRSE
jgi:ABC-type antimicrobial peptide transport system permease subunit